MYFAQIAVATAYIVICFVKGDHEKKNSEIKEHNDNSNEGSDSLEIADYHTFVALIDIVFMDQTQRTCTGAIIHETVVITAAHCFSGKDRYNQAKVELTASFVVIGTKAMFESGYEQYLPIEKLITHPQHDMWSADLALVYTFASMTTSKPGAIIPIAGLAAASHIDSNVTVYSWGSSDTISENEEKVAEPPAEEAHESCSEENEDVSTEKPQTKKSTRHAAKRAVHTHRFRNSPQQPDVTTSKLLRTKKSQRSNQSKKIILRSETTDLDKEKETKQTTIKTTKRQSRYLTAARKKENTSFSIQPYEFGEYEAEEENSGEKMEVSQDHFKHTRTDNHKKEINILRSMIKPEQSIEKLDDIQLHTNWRRNMGSQKNKLFSENFGLVNVQACKTLVEKAMPTKYALSSCNDACCYASSNRVLKDGDSGAPAVGKGKLVAITIGGVECDGETAAIGMKMNCFCSWIADNLPSGGSKLKCCKNCCDIKHIDDSFLHKPKKHRI